ncbi:hypothetical protein D9619_001408 [Psilocybe cf. subviscida]|uniref:HeH/LEM domain-containing protein n=1 Tax=Psilocybe cf. subviscida TaxID=2480587 RepID=A0A8H5BE15_9AGAR|nr:hypothetical protein D9619_001408 [Psilocybe cf. subviscida]
MGMRMSVRVLSMRVLHQLSHSSHSPIMDAKLKSLKVADLRTILTNAAVSFPAKATKADLIARIQASQEARDAYTAIYDASVNVAPAQEDAQDIPYQQESVTEASEPPPSPPKEQAIDQTPVADAAPAAPASSTQAGAAPAAEDPELEARRKRAARFGIPLVEAKQPKKPVAKTPKAPPATKAKVEVDDKVLAERAARFGIKDDEAKAAPATKQNGKKRTAAQVEPPVDPEEEEKRRKRAERFGTKA